MEEEREQEIIVKFLPFDISVAVAPATTIRDAAREADLPLSAPCGGKGTCGDCVVQVIEGEYRSKPSAALPQELARQGYVLACTTEVTDSITVDLPHFEEFYIKSVADLVLSEDERENISANREIGPVVTKLQLDVPAPTLEVNYSDLTRVLRELRKSVAAAEVRCEYSVMKSLAGALREQDGRVSVVLHRDGPTETLIDVRPADCGNRIYGIACDIGTTTVALSIVNLETGEVVETALGLNRQLKCGEDIISRINYAARPRGLDELHDLVIATINTLIEKAVEGRSISNCDIHYASVSGNTTMLHLLLRLDPRYIREEPYVPTFNHAPLVKAHDLGLRINPEARVHCAPAVGSYVGGDITAGLLATPMLRDSARVSMFIDVGTNGELVIGNRDWLMTCACSAGPAFEGGGVRCGMPATEGAIERIRMCDDGDLHYEVIGESKPRGICGSGLVDLLAELLVHGYLDRQGRFRTDRDPRKLIENEDESGFLIERGDRCYWGRDLVITEKDITNLIRTKGAIFSACSLLLKQVGLALGQIDAVYLAGGFGHYLDIENAVRIGLVPDIGRDRFHYLGNSSLLGAYLILVSDRNRETVAEISKKMTYVELNTEPSYMNEYTGALFLPHTDLDLFPSVKQILKP